MASTKIVWESPALESLFYILNVPSALLANCFIPIWQHWNNKDLSYNLCCVVGCIYSRVNRHSGNSLWQFVLWSHTPVFKKQHSPWQLHKRDIFRFIYSPLPSTVSIKHTAESKTISSRSHLSMDVSPFFHITSELDFSGGHNSRGGCGILFLRETPICCPLTGGRDEIICTLCTRCSQVFFLNRMGFFPTLSLLHRAFRVVFWNVFLWINGG